MLKNEYNRVAYIVMVERLEIYGVKFNYSYSSTPVGNENIHKIVVRTIHWE